MDACLDFEKPIAGLEKQLRDLRETAEREGVGLGQEIRVLEKKVRGLIDDTFAKLTPWQRVQLSRHPLRPHSRDYIDQVFPDFLELHGDRAFGDDRAIVGGVATWKNQPVLVLGHQKGRTTKQKMERNFGMAKPEGYRKAIRLMRMADRFKMPIVTLIDTPGAYPGIEAEERGQSQSIAESIEVMFGLRVPVVSVVIGEGGSGGALALGVADRVLMQEYGTYSVISPESCASILWSDSGLAERASEKLKMSPAELLKHGVIDGIVAEPRGGAHRDPAAAAELLREALDGALTELLKTYRKNPDKLARARQEKFRAMGNHAIEHAPT